MEDTRHATSHDGQRPLIIAYNERCVPNQISFESGRTALTKDVFRIHVSWFRKMTNLDLTKYNCKFDERCLPWKTFFVKGFINNIKRVTYRNFSKSIHEEVQGVPMHSITYTPITHWILMEVVFSCVLRGN